MPGWTREFSIFSFAYSCIQISIHSSVVLVLVQKMATRSTTRGPEVGATWALGDDLIQGRKRGVIFGWADGGRKAHVRMVTDWARWPEDVGTCEDWLLTECNRVARGNLEQFRRITSAPRRCITGLDLLKLSGCLLCMRGHMQMARNVSDADEYTSS